MMSTMIRRMQLRKLAHRVAHARFAAVQQSHERESAMQRDGAAHPRSIRANRRLARTRAAYRALLATYRRRTREDTRDG